MGDPAFPRDDGTVNRIGLRSRRPRDSGPLRRRREDRLAGGVAAGLARRTGFDVTAVRLAFVVATVLSVGVMVAVYVAAWLLIPLDGETGPIAARAVTDRRGLAVAVGLGS